MFFHQSNYEEINSTIFFFMLTKSDRKPVAFGITSQILLKQVAHSTQRDVVKPQNLIQVSARTLRELQKCAGVCIYILFYTQVKY